MKGVNFCSSASKTCTPCVIGSPVSKAGSSGCANHMLRRFMQKCIPTFISILVTGIRWIPQYLLISAEIQCKLQSHSQSVIPLFFSTYCTSVASLLKQWLTSGQCHKPTSQSDAPCSQLRLLRPLCRATLYIKTCDILRRRKNLGKTSQSLGEAAKGALPSDFALYEKIVKLSLLFNLRNCLFVCRYFPVPYQTFHGFKFVKMICP